MTSYLESFLQAPRERRRRTVIFLAAGVVLAYLPLDAHVRPGALGVLVLLRVAWALLLVGIGLAQPRATPERWGRLILLGATASNVIYLALLAEAGGLATPQAVWLPVMPLATVLLAWERVGAVLLGGLATLAGTVALAARGGGADAVLVWGSITGGTVVLAAGTSLAFQVMRRDETRALAARDEAQARLRESELRRERAERLLFAGRIASGVAHAVNSPLAAARTNLHELQAPADPGGADAADRREALDDTAAAVERIARTVGALRFFSQDEWTAAAPACAPAAAIAVSTREAARLLPAGVTLRCAVAADLPDVAVGEPLLEQVLLGLVLDAGAAGRRGDRVRPVRLTLEASREGGGVAVAVAGEGPASPDAASLSRALDVRAATWEPGRGLAPAMARELVELEGGRLEVSWRPGGGACHKLWLPEAGPTAGHPVP